jgi:hypothetical protein
VTKGGISMATSSILKNLNITKKGLAFGYVRALEHAASNEHSRKAEIPDNTKRNEKTLRRDEIKDFFDVK